MDIERTMQFLLDQQAKHDAWQQRFEEDFARINNMFSSTLSRFGDQLLETRELLVQVAESQQRTNAIVERLTEKHFELAEKHEDIAKKHEDLASKQESLANRISDLAVLIERHVSDHN